MVKSNSNKNLMAGIILGAGMSTRLSRPKQLKQLLPLNSKYLIERVLDAARGSKLAEIYLVLGFKAQEIITCLGSKTQDKNIHVVINPEYKKGLSQSLRAGLMAVENQFSSIMFLLGDQPMIDSQTIDLLMDQFYESGKDICAPIYQGKRGNPVIFSQTMYKELKIIQGDQGARDIIKNNPDRLHLVEINTPLFFFDIDTQNDYLTIKKIIADSE